MPLKQKNKKMSDSGKKKNNTFIRWYSAFLFCVIGWLLLGAPYIEEKKKQEQAERQKKYHQATRQKYHQAKLNNLALQTNPDTLKIGCDCKGRHDPSSYKSKCNYTFDLNASEPFPGLIIVDTRYYEDGSTEVSTEPVFIHHVTFSRDELRFSEHYHFYMNREGDFKGERARLDRKTLTLKSNLFLFKFEIMQCKLGHYAVPTPLPPASDLTVPLPSQKF